MRKDKKDVHPEWYEHYREYQREYMRKRRAENKNYGQIRRKQDEHDTTRHTGTDGQTTEGTER